MNYGHYAERAMVDVGNWGEETTIGKRNRIKTIIVIFASNPSTGYTRVPFVAVVVNVVGKLRAILQRIVFYTVAKFYCRTLRIVTGVPDDMFWDQHFIWLDYFYFIRLKMFPPVQTHNVDAWYNAPLYENEQYYCSPLLKPQIEIN